MRISSTSSLASFYAGRVDASIVVAYGNVVGRVCAVASFWMNHRSIVPKHNFNSRLNYLLTLAFLKKFFARPPTFFKHYVRARTKFTTDNDHHHQRSLNCSMAWHHGDSASLVPEVKLGCRIICIFEPNPLWQCIEASVSLGAVCGSTSAVELN